MQTEKNSVGKDGNPSTSVDATAVDESDTAVDAVVNEYWRSPVETAQADSEKSIYPSRVASGASEQGSDDGDNDEELKRAASDGETPNDEAVPTLALRDGKEFPALLL